MKRIRIGKDFAVKWSIYSKTNEGKEPYLLDPKNCLLRLISPFKKEQVDGFLIEGNTLTWAFRGRDQKMLGVYSLELVEHNGASGMVTIDACKAFELVAQTCDETGNNGGDIVIDALSLEGEVMLAPAKIEVDDYMSSESINPVQNKVVKAYVDDIAQSKQDIISDIATIRANSAKGATALQEIPSEYVTESELAGKGYATKSELQSLTNEVSASYESLNNMITNIEQSIIGALNNPV